MSAGKHTEGPWTIQRSKDLHDGQYDFAINATKAKVIAEAFGRDTRGNIIAAEANARLIAAAPDMLAALRYVETRCVSEAAYPHACIEDRKMRDMVMAAIARAEGRS